MAVGVQVPLRVHCENSSVGRARPCQGRGREFESRFSLKKALPGMGCFFNIYRNENISAYFLKGRSSPVIFLMSFSLFKASSGVS